MYKVLLVDDEYMIPMGLKKLVDWKSLGFEVVAVAESANEALSIMEEQRIDLVITDVTMPEINGLEFIEAAQKQQFEFEFMILSGYQEFSYLKSGLQLGAVNYLMKPVNKQELLDTLKKVSERLNQQVYQKNQQEIHQENLLAQWLNDELDERGEEEVSQLLTSEKIWTVLLVQVDRLKGQIVTNWLREHCHCVYFQRNLGDATLLTLLCQGIQEEMFLAFMERQFGSGNWWVSVGEKGRAVEDIPISYQSVKDSLQLHQFYNYPERIVYAEKMQGQHQLMDFSEFNRLLRDNKLHEAEISLQNLFMQIHHLTIAPENARQIAFLLFMDIRRELLLLEDEEYLSVVNKISNSVHIDELRDLLLQTLREQKEHTSYSENVARVVQIIQENYQEELTLKDVANQLFLNALYLGQLFKKETKKSFSQYLNHYRIEKAKQLLSRTEDNVNEVALAIGYNNTTYFSKKFKNIVGVSPKDFRKQASE